MARGFGVVSWLCAMDPTKDDLPSAPAFPSLEENPSKDYWAFKKKRRREKEHSAEETPKAPKLEEGSSPSEPRPSDDTTQKRNWKNLEISEIPFFSPTIAVDCSFEEQMSHKVRPVFWPAQLQFDRF